MSLGLMTAPPTSTHQPQDALIDLVRRVQIDPSDRRAKEALAEAIAPGILATARRFCRLEHDADETAQDALVAILQHIQDLQDTHAFRSWMYRIVYRASLRSNSGPGADAMPLTMELPDTKTMDQADAAEAREHLDFLRESIAELDREAAGILHLLFVENLSLQEVAMVIGRPRTTVADLRERALETLRGKMRRRGVQIATPSLSALLFVALPMPMPQAAVQRVIQSAWSRIDGVSLMPAPAAPPAGYGLFTKMSLSKAFLFSCLVTLVAASIFSILQFPRRSSETSTESSMRVMLNSISGYKAVYGNAYPLDRDWVVEQGENLDRPDLEVDINANVVKNLLANHSQGELASLGEGRFRTLADGRRIVIDEYGAPLVIKPLLEKRGNRWQVSGMVVYSKGSNGSHDWSRLRYLAYLGAGVGGDGQPQPGCWPPPQSICNQWPAGDPNLDNLYLSQEDAR